MNDSLIILALGAAAAGFVQGLTGFAFGLVALAFWAWVLEPAIAGPLVVLGSTLGHLFSLARARRGFDLSRMLPMTVGGLLGVPLGVMLLRHVNLEMFRLSLGALLVVYCPAMLASHKIAAVERAGALADGAIGVVSGILGGLSGLSGPVSTLWCTLRGWDRDAQRAAFQSFNFTMQIATLVAYALGGVFSRALFGDFAIAAPAIAVMAFVGGHVYASTTDRNFRRIVLVLLTVSGVVMIVSALSYRLASPAR